MIQWFLIFPKYFRRIHCYSKLLDKLSQSCSSSISSVVTNKHVNQMIKNQHENNTASRIMSIIVIWRSLSLCLSLGKVYRLWWTPSVPIWIQTSKTFACLPSYNIFHSQVTSNIRRCIHLISCRSKDSFQPTCIPTVNTENGLAQGGKWCRDAPSNAFEFWRSVVTH